MEFVQRSWMLLPPNRCLRKSAVYKHTTNIEYAYDKKLYKAKHQGSI